MNSYPVQRLLDDLNNLNALFDYLETRIAIYRSHKDEFLNLHTPERDHPETLQINDAIHHTNNRIHTVPFLHHL